MVKFNKKLFSCMLFISISFFTMSQGTTSGLTFQEKINAINSALIELNPNSKLRAINVIESVRIEEFISNGGLSINDGDLYDFTKSILITFEDEEKKEITIYRVPVYLDGLTDNSNSFFATFIKFNNEYKGFFSHIEIRVSGEITWNILNEDEMLEKGYIDCVRDCYEQRNNYGGGAIDNLPGVGEYILPLFDPIAGSGSWHGCLVHCW